MFNVQQQQDNVQQQQEDQSNSTDEEYAQISPRSDKQMQKAKKVRIFDSSDVRIFSSYISNFTYYTTGLYL